MTKNFFPKLAANNIKNNSKTYIPYILTCSITTAMFYIVKSLSLNPGLEKTFGGDTLSYSMHLGSRIIAIFAFIFLFYTNSFLMKKRKKEFGVFNILGMEKRHLMKTIGFETIYVTLISLAIGLLLGISLDKLSYLVITKVAQAEIAMGFFLSWKAVGSTILLFCVIYMFIFLNAARGVHTANPIDLLRAGSVGEKEPKTKIIMTLFGAACLGTGYYIAITTKNPIASLAMFFVAVILVVIGTYALFATGSIALLKALRKNKNYYYKPKHFISVSGMIYRMKRNAVGLANICVLSTMVLVMISSTTSMMIGMEDIIKTRYPMDFAVYFNEDEEDCRQIIESIKALQKEKELSVTNETEYTYLSFSGLKYDNSFIMDRENISLGAMNSINNLFFIALADYNNASREHKELNEGEILIYSNRGEFNYDTLKLFDKEYAVKEQLDSFIGNGILSANIADSRFIVVPDKSDLEEIYELQKKEYEKYAGEIRVFYGFDSDEDDDTQNLFYENLIDFFTSREYEGTLESRAESRQSFIGVYGGLFFIGVFLSILFVMATVLIIYYKQISEGYEDRERFQIMRKVGMSSREIKSSINSQVLTVFFLPLIASGIHVAAASPLISRILAVLNLLNVKLYVVCTIVCFLIFTLIYVIIYMLTAKIYYRIVSRGR